MVRDILFGLFYTLGILIGAYTAWAIIVWSALAMIPGLRMKRAGGNATIAALLSAVMIGAAAIVDKDWPLGGSAIALAIIGIVCLIIWLNETPPPPSGPHDS
jgi:hypothetical protein